MINDLNVIAARELAPAGAAPGEHATQPRNGSPLRDESRLRCAEIGRAFTSVIRASSQGAQSEVSGPDEVALGPDDAISDAQLIRGVD